jgi:alpha-N-arabinofuranosidase
MRTLFFGSALLGMATTAPVVAAQRVQLSVDVSKAGTKIDRNIFGQFAEHLGHGVYDGIWVGADSTIPNTRGMRNALLQRLGQSRSQMCAGQVAASPTNTTGAMASALSDR